MDEGDERAMADVAAPAGDPAEPLARRLARGPLGTEAALTLGLQLASALAELHGAGRTHLALDPTAVAWRDADRRARLEARAGAAQQLAYTAPEQTGRLDAQPDARSDLYALGIVLHEALVGAPPMRSDDALAQIHWHIAGVPRPLTTVDPAIPPVLSDIVLKLIAKSPDERYQSAVALAQDLTACLRDWVARGAIAPFPLARRDRGERLRVPARLYGREREVQQLLAAFDRVCAGGRVAVLVEGWSGIGKTALIQQLVRPIVRQRGHFLAGKFDQVARGVPFGALIQAFRGLVRQLLGHSEAQLAAWREAMRTGLGDNGGVLTEVIPELAFIVGPQPAPVPLAGLEAQNRFQRVLQNVVATLATRAHPMVLFLDDLQWADAATLSLLEPLLAAGEIGSLMLIGACRDNEIDSSPHLAHTLASLEGAGLAAERLALGPLAVDDVVALVADTLHDGGSEAATLARLVHGKTGGNPFFAIQFLQALAREGHLRFDDEEGRWRCATPAIAALPLADNVVELMTRNIRRLAARAQTTLTLAACIGNRFDAATLAQVAGMAADAVDADLLAARAEGLIVESRQGDTPAHAFLHDRVQQAAYALIPPARRAAVHLAVGRLLRSRAGDGDDDAAQFDTVQHLNRGAELIDTPAERREVAALNLVAGRRAKASAAHETARELFRQGLALLAPAAWRDDHAFAFALALDAAESEMLCGDFAAAQAALAELLPRADGPVERARAVHLRSLALEAEGRYADALASTREGLAPLGVNLPEDEAAQQAALDREIDTIEALRAGRPIESLVDLPTLADPSVRLVMAMLTDVWSDCYLVGQATLARLISATLVRLSLEHGNAEESAYGYVTHAITVGPVRGHYREAHAFGLLALAVNARFDDRRRRAKIYQQFHAHVNLWCEPMASCIPYAREACRAGLDGGAFLYAVYASASEVWAAMTCTDDLAGFVREYEASVVLIERLKNPPFADSLRVILGWARALQGLTEAPLSLGDATFDEAAWVERYRGNGFFGCTHAVVRLQLCMLLGDPAQALDAARHSASLVGHAPGTVWPVLHDFWHGLALARAYDLIAPDEQAEALAQVRRAQETFEARAAFCAVNFHTQALILAAEVARLEGRPRDAVEAFAQAIEFAVAPGLLSLQAVAHERCADLHAALGQVRLAALHRAAAREGFARWGAGAKVAALDEVADGGAALPQRPVASAPHDEPDALDHVSVLKAAQAIAAETGVGALLDRLMHIALENAGADRGALVLDTESGPVVHAFAADVAAPSTDGEPLDAAHSVPAGIVRYVLRTAQAVVLADATFDDQHGGDPYVLRERPRSLLVLPLQLQGRSLGVLVLENRHVGGVFSAPRLATMSVLATQAAISLENARLLARLEAENTSLRRDLIANVSHDLRTPLVSMRGYLELLAAKGDMLAPQTRADYLAIATRQCERLGTLVDELFELAKLDFKGMALQREPFAFAELALDVAHKFRLEARSHDVSLEVRAAPALPFVDGDLGLMERVLENLIANALRHTPPGGRIELGIERDGDAVAVHVQDSGCGIAPADLPHIFDRFWRGRGGGTGLGLAITRRILELHGSAIAAHSDGRSGSCFRFRLPAARRPQASMAARRANDQ